MGKLAGFLSDVLCPDSLPPDSWKEARLKLSFKKGITQDAGNYRPMSMIPMLEKVSYEIAERPHCQIFE